MTGDVLAEGPRAERLGRWGRAAVEAEGLLGRPLAADEDPHVAWLGVARAALAGDVEADRRLSRWVAAADRREAERVLLDALAWARWGT